MFFINLFYMIQTLNIEKEALACDQAIATVLQEIEVLTLQNEIKVLKVIHGYGSSGTGGKIKKELSLCLQNLVRQNKVKYFVQNEKFTPLKKEYSYYTKLYPSLILESDLQNQNPGITLIFLNN